MINRIESIELDVRVVQTVINTIEYNYYNSENTYINKTTIAFNDSIIIDKNDLEYISKKYDIINSNELDQCGRVEQGLLIFFKTIKLITIENQSNILVKVDFATREPNVFGNAEFEFIFKNNIWSLEKWNAFSTSIGN